MTRSCTSWPPHRPSMFIDSFRPVSCVRMHMQRCVVGGTSCSSSSHSDSSSTSPGNSEQGHASGSSTSSRVVHNPYKYISVATQYVYAGAERNPILARVSVVEYRGTVVYDSYVYPNFEPVSDFRTVITGIEAVHLYNAPNFLEVRANVEALIRNKIIIGHSLWEDLSLLGLVHPALETRDVALFLPFHRTMKCLSVTPLKHLMMHLMRRKIGLGCENSIEDARASLDLFRSYEERWETVIDSGVWPSALPPSSHMQYFL